MFVVFLYFSGVAKNVHVPTVVCVSTENWNYKNVPVLKNIRVSKLFMVLKKCLSLLCICSKNLKSDWDSQKKSRFV